MDAAKVMWLLYEVGGWHLVERALVGAVGWGRVAGSERASRPARHALRLAWNAHHQAQPDWVLLPCPALRSYCLPAAIRHQH